MPDIIIAKNWNSNEFGVISALYALVGYCVYPNDGNKRQKMAQVLNVEVLHKLKYDWFDLEKHKDELDNPEKADEFWRELREFVAEKNVEIPENLPDLIAPRKFVESVKSNLLKLATNSLDIPKDIERFLLHAPTPAHFKEERKAAIRGITTALLIVFKLLQMTRDMPDIRGGVSLKKAIELLATTGEAPIKNSTDIRLAWDKYKKSVHIGFGLLLTLQMLIKTEFIKNHNKGKGFVTDFLSPICVTLTIIFAASLQEWLLSFKLSRHTPATTATRLIKPTQLWMIPRKVKLPENLRLEKWLKSFPPLKERELKLLKEKRS